MEGQVKRPEGWGAREVAATPPPAAAAIRHPPTRAAFRQRQSGPHIVVGGSLVLLTVFVVVVGWAHAHSDRLAATGLDTGGEVVEVRGPPRISLFDSGSVVVAYQVEQEPAPRRAVVRLNDLSPAYQAGDHVQVRYDPDAPARATIAGEDNEPPLLVAVGILTFVLGGMGLPIGLGWWLGGRALHHELAHNRWRAGRYRHAAVPVVETGDGTQTVHVLAVDARAVNAGAPPLWQASAIGKADDGAWQPAGTLWVAGDPGTRRRVVVGLPDADAMSLYRARRLRGELRARALAALAALPPPD
jgi:Protein of unknown function (DUF3592)